MNRLERADESTSVGSTLTPRDYSYEYDDASNLTKETVDGQSKSYSYNLAHELEQRDGASFHAYDHKRQPRARHRRQRLPL